jgi:hypothetical protein
MPSGSDFFNQLKDANTNLNNIANKLDLLITLGAYTNQALFQNALQNDTIICVLEKISKNTCDLVNQSHLQTALQAAIHNNTAALAEMFALTHAEAALAREREQALRGEIEKCCPPKPPAPICTYKPCPAPGPLGEPPDVGPIIG